MSGLDPESQLQPGNLSSFFDYSSVQGYAESYASQYYINRDVCADVRMSYRFFLTRLRQWAVGSGQWARRFCELGCGPTVHNALFLAPFVSEIVLSDYLEENLEQVSMWVRRNPEAISWDHYTRYLLELDGMEVDDKAIESREEETRSKIREVVSCNILEPLPLGRPGQFELVGCFHCLEAVARNSDGLETILKNVCNIVAPGGTLMIAMLAATDFYHVAGLDGTPINIPCLEGNLEMVANAVRLAGLQISEGDIAITSVDGQEEEGVTGLIHVWATKP